MLLSFDISKKKKKCANILLIHYTFFSFFVALESLILYVQLCKSRYSFKSFNNASNVVSRLSLFEAEFLIGDFL